MGKIQDTRDLLEIVGEFSKAIKGEKTDSLRIECMNGLGIYSTTINVESGFSKWVNKAISPNQKFDQQQVYSVKAYGIKPLPRKIDDAVKIEGNQIILDLRKVLNEELIRIEIAYKMDDEWLEGIVRARSSPEPLQDAQKWNLSAQLKDPQALIGGFSEIDIEEFPVSARVHIKEQINTNLPSFMKKMAKVEAKILADYDPRHATKIIGLQKEKAQIQKRMGKTDLMTKLNEISTFLRPTKFTNYVNMSSSHDFRLHCCEWGSEIFRALGMMPLPSKMNIISRTDLSLQKPATSGVMVYESGRFEKDLKQVFEKKQNKKSSFGAKLNH